MHILIAGGSGFLGHALSRTLARARHHISILTRQPTPATGADNPVLRHITWSPDGSVGPWADSCAGTDVIVNLAGASIAGSRWSASRKAELLASRAAPTRSLARFIEQASPPPSAFISSSAIGFYGDRGDTPLDERARDGSDFLAELAYAWEQEALKAASAGTRVALVRTGIVLDARQGALAKMLAPFRLFAGGPFGSGRQYMSWIHRDDWVALVTWLVETPGLAGPFNATAPAPVTNREFAKTLGRVLRRPAFVRAPGFALKLALGEMAGPLLLGSQRVVPARAQQAGFVFRFPDLEPALRDLLARHPARG